MTAGVLSLCGCDMTRPQTETPPAWLGVNTMLGYPELEGAFSSARKTAPERAPYLQLLDELGPVPVRDLLMCWPRSQPMRGDLFDFTLSDELVRAYVSRRSEILALCWGVPGWATGKSKALAFDFGVPARENEDAFRQFVRTFVERYDGDGQADMPELKGRIRGYEFLQEMEDIPADEYAWWLRVFYESVKDADPQAIVSIGSLRSPGAPLPGDRDTGYTTYLDKVLASSALTGPAYPYFDVVSFHNYPASYRGRPPFDAAHGSIRQSLGNRGLTRPIWLTEFGQTGEGRSEEAQRDDLVKWAIHARALGIERAFVYCLADYRCSPNDPPEALGLVREAPVGETPQRKPAFEALVTLLKQTADRPEVARRDRTVYSFTGNDDTAYVIWREADQEMPALIGSDWWELTNLSGQTVKRQGTQMELTGTPLFARRTKSPFLSQSEFMKQGFMAQPDKEDKEKEKEREKEKAREKERTNPDEGGK